MHECPSVKTCLLGRVLKYLGRAFTTLNPGVGETFVSFLPLVNCLEMSGVT